MAPPQRQKSNAASITATTSAMPPVVTKPIKNPGPNAHFLGTSDLPFTKRNGTQTADGPGLAGDTDASNHKNPSEFKDNTAASIPQTTMTSAGHLEPYVLYTFVSHSGTDRQYRLDLVPLAENLLERQYNTATLDSAMENLLILQPGECALMIQQANDREGAIVSLKHHTDTKIGTFGSVPSARSLTFIVKTTLPALKGFSRSGLLSQFQAHSQGQGQEQVIQQVQPQVQPQAQPQVQPLVTPAQFNQAGTTSTGAKSSFTPAQLQEMYDRNGFYFSYSEEDSLGTMDYQSIAISRGIGGISFEELRLSDYEKGHRGQQSLFTTSSSFTDRFNKPSLLGSEDKFFKGFGDTASFIVGYKAVGGVFNRPGKLHGLFEGVAQSAGFGKPSGIFGVFGRNPENTSAFGAQGGAPAPSLFVHPTFSQAIPAATTAFKAESANKLYGLFKDLAVTEESKDIAQRKSLFGTPAGKSVFTGGATPKEAAQKHSNIFGALTGDSAPGNAAAEKEAEPKMSPSIFDATADKKPGQKSYPSNFKKPVTLSEGRFLSGNTDRLFGDAAAPKHQGTGLFGVNSGNGVFGANAGTGSSGAKICGGLFHNASGSAATPGLNAQKPLAPLGNSAKGSGPCSTATTDFGVFGDNNNNNTTAKDGEPKKKPVDKDNYPPYGFDPSQIKKPVRLKRLSEMSPAEITTHTAHTRAYQEARYAWLKDHPKPSKEDAAEFKRLEMILGHDLARIAKEEDEKDAYW